MAEVTFDTSAWGELQKQIADMEKRAADLSPVTQVAAALLEGQVISPSFETSSSPLGRAWAPLADSTVAQRRKGSARPLVDTGQLKGSTNARGTRSGVRFGVSGAAATYGPTHQFGTTKAGRGRRTRIPARPFLPLDSQGRPSFASGRAAAWYAKTQRRVYDYVLYGKTG